MENEPVTKKAKLLIPKIVSVEPEKLLREVLAAKKWMNSAERCADFTADLTQFRRLLQFVAEKIGVLAGAEESSAVMVSLRESISFLANCCFYSTACQFEVLREAIFGNFIQILRNETVRELWTPTVRLVSNLCVRKESASIVVQAVDGIPSLVDLLSSSTDAKLVKVLLRCFRMLTELGRGFRKNLIRNQLPFALALRTEEEEITRSLLQKLAAEDPAATGKQLARSDFVQKLVEKGPGSYLKDPILSPLLEGSCDVRNALSSAGVVEELNELVQAEEVDMDILRFLIHISKDASGRAKVRRSANLFGLFIRAIQSCPLGSQSLLDVFDALMNYVYDSWSLEQLLFAPAFLEQITACFEAWILLSPAHQCPLEKSAEPAGPEEYRPDSPSFLRIERETAQWGSGIVRNSWFTARSVSPSPPRHFIRRPVGSWSPSASSVGSYASSPASSDIDETFSCSSGFETIELSAVDEENVHRRTIHQILFLLSWFSHSEQYLPRLCSQPFLFVLLRYISRSKQPDPRSGRILLRLARSRSVLELVLNAELPLMTFREFFAAKDQHCPTCPSLRFAEKLMESLKDQAESCFGLGLLSHWLLGSSPDAKPRAARSIPFVIGKGSQRQKLLRETGFLRLLIDSLLDKAPGRERDAESLLQLYSFHQRESTFPPVYRQRQCFAAERQKPASPEQQQDVCHFPAAGGGDGELLRFHDDGKSGDGIAVSKERLCAESRYFESMFRGGFFAEASSSEFRVTDCGMAAFTRFLHHLHGCPPACVVPDSAAELMALISLGSKHCRTDLFARLRPGIGRFLDGEDGADILLLTLMVGAEELAVPALQHFLSASSAEELVTVADFVSERGNKSELAGLLETVLRCCA